MVSVILIIAINFVQLLKGLISNGFYVVLQHQLRNVRKIKLDFRYEF